MDGVSEDTREGINEKQRGQRSEFRSASHLRPSPFLSSLQAAVASLLIARAQCRCSTSALPLAENRFPHSDRQTDTEISGTECGCCCGSCMTHRLPDYFLGRTGAYAIHQPTHTDTYSHYKINALLSTGAASSTSAHRMLHQTSVVRVANNVPVHHDVVRSIALKHNYP